MTAEWKPLGTPAPTALVGARLQLHWAMQVVGAAGDAVLERAHDDSQSASCWSAERQCWLGKARVGLRPCDLTLLLGDAELALSGGTLADAMHWLCENLGADLTLRDYDMPSHPVAQGAALELGDCAAFQELARWYHDADLVLTPFAEGTALHTWPHHFDLGALLLLEEGKSVEEARSIGIGMSPGDGNFAEPYFYVTPFPVLADPDLPALDGGGTWETERFFGAVLTGSNLVRARDQRAQAEAFLRSAMAAARELLA